MVHYDQNAKISMRNPTPAYGGKQSPHCQGHTTPFVLQLIHSPLKSTTDLDIGLALVASTHAMDVWPHQ